jgi:diphosphoinositol-polyphosphate diphosphatase
LHVYQGGWELDESVEEAASRESLEEAGVLGNVEVGVLLPVANYLCSFFNIMCWLDFFEQVFNMDSHTWQDELGKWNFLSKRHGTFYEGFMFPLFVTKQLDLWPEKSVRQRIWVCCFSFCCCTMLKSLICHDIVS